MLLKQIRDHWDDTSCADLVVDRARLVSVFISLHARWSGWSVDHIWQHMSPFFKKNLSMTLELIAFTSSISHESHELQPCPFPHFPPPWLSRCSDRSPRCGRWPGHGEPLSCTLAASPGCLGSPHTTGDLMHRRGADHRGHRTDLWNMVRWTNRGRTWSLEIGWATSVYSHLKKKCGWWMYKLVDNNSNSIARWWLHVEMIEWLPLSSPSAREWTSQNGRPFIAVTSPFLQVYPV